MRQRDFWNVVVDRPDPKSQQNLTPPSSDSESVGFPSSVEPASSYQSTRSGSRRSSRESDSSRESGEQYSKRPYGCHVCSTTFKRKYDLVQHVSAVHDKKRPYGCSKCQSRFAHKGTLTKHVSYKDSWGLHYM